METNFGKLHYVLEKGLDAVLVTIIAEKGSSPRGTGSQMLISSAGRECGTIGGGAVEKKAEILASTLISEKRSAVHEYTLRKGSVEDIGMECGGDVTLFLQYIDSADKRWDELCSVMTEVIENGRKAWLLQHLDGSLPEIVTADETEQRYSGADLFASGSVLKDGTFVMPVPIGERAIIFGGGHCAAALAPILDSVGFRVTVMDCREEFVTEERFPMAEQRICGSFETISQYIELKEDDYLVVMTNGHVHDYEVEEQILRKKSAYVGVIGSRSKTASVNKRLRQSCVPEEMIQKVHTPIGLSIKAVTPSEIAVSIAAEMILVRAEAAEKSGELTGSCPMH